LSRTDEDLEFKCPFLGQYIEVRSRIKISSQMTKSISDNSQSKIRRILQVKYFTYETT